MSLAAHTLQYQHAFRTFRAKGGNSIVGAGLCTGWGFLWGGGQHMDLYHRTWLIAVSAVGVAGVLGGAPVDHWLYQDQRAGMGGSPPPSHSPPLLMPPPLYQPPPLSDSVAFIHRCWQILTLWRMGGLGG
jgi:hypothetical protein